MNENNRTYRIRTKVGEDKFLNVNINQDIEQIEILSLKLDVENFYKLHTSNYGCLVGRVLANQGVGVPNVKISVFIPVESADMENPIFRYLYPYSNTKSKDENGVRYNLLPDVVDDKCHQDIGTFPNKRLVLDDENVVEVFDKYFKYTTVTNASGDYMLFGLPVGNNIIHSELDLSDIGILSQKPRDLYYKGYNHTQFENSSQFKKSTNLDYLTQVIVQDNPVQVYSFWGDDETGEYDGVDAQVKITRSDIDINYKFEPTCIFIGSLVADDKSNGFSKKCTPTERSGKMDRLTTGTGTIEMIRKTPDGGVESFSVQGNDLIDGNGTWCYQIPMNLDYVKTDEYGNLVPAENEMTGIPTRTRVRFRISLADYESDTASAHLPKVLVPNNPTTEELIKPVKYKVDDEHYLVVPQGPDYNFGTYTREESFRDLFWNNVYTVKQYIPRIQNILFDGAHIDRNRNFSGIKAVNVNGSNNPIPYNNIRVNLTFLFIFQCIIFKALVLIVKILNKVIYVLQVLADSLAYCCNNSQFAYITLDGAMCPTMEGYQMALGAVSVTNNNDKNKNNIKDKSSAGKLVAYTYLSGNSERGTSIGGESEYSETTEDGDEKFGEGSAYQSINRNPNIDEKASDTKYANSQLPELYDSDSSETPKEQSFGTAMISASADYFVKCVELQFAMEYEVIQFDFYNDWINGLIYLPRWFAELKRKKRVDRVQACNENFSGYREMVQQCAVYYDEGDELYHSSGNNGGRTSSTCTHNCHRKGGRSYVKVFVKHTHGWPKYDMDGNYIGNQYFPDGGIIQTFKNRIDDRYLYYLRPSKCINQNTKQNNESTGVTLATDKNINVKANLFATDIVLLGNVLECNKYGIPTATGYPSSTFSMPPPTGQLLSDSQEMSMYYSKDDSYDAGGDYYFIKQNKRNPNQSQDDYESLQIEMSGIDWGYNPFKVDKNTDKTEKIYNQQGGHFLEIGCVAADVTPKSCLNLQRVCELGSEMAQSHYYRNSDGSSNSFFGTSGVVSTREVIGEDMRTKFASLNSNRLGTTTGNKTPYQTYEFFGYTPTTFNGAFNGWQTDYAEQETKDFIGNIADGHSRSYVAFRFAENLHNTNRIDYNYGGNVGKISVNEGSLSADSISDKSTGGIRNKCLMKNSVNGNKNQYTMPVYENSFYFYFGLKDGNTAIDRLYTEYFSECTANGEVEDGESLIGS